MTIQATTPDGSKLTIEWDENSADLEDALGYMKTIMNYLGFTYVKSIEATCNFGDVFSSDPAYEVKEVDP